jgi:hypothetical protein
MPQDEQTRVDSEAQMEIYNLLRALLRRVELLEKHVGLTPQAVKPCVYCNTTGGHQAWCHVTKAPGGK